MILERECLDLSEAIEQLSEKQKLLATLMEGKMRLQKVAPEEIQRQIFQVLIELEEQKTKEVLEQLGRKHKLGRLEKERNRARMLQAMEPSGVEGGFTGAVGSPPFVLAHLPCHMTRMKQCPLPPGCHRQGRRKVTG